MKQFRAKTRLDFGIHNSGLRNIVCFFVIVAGLVNNKVHTRAINDSKSYVFRKAAGIIT
jgi:hypothetical protein